MQKDLFMLTQLMKQYPFLMDLIAFIYNLIHKNNAWKYKSVIIAKGVFLKNVKFSITGKNNKIIIGRKARLRDCKIKIYGNNCLLKIGGGSTIISKTSFWLQDDNCEITIGRDFTMESGHIASTEGDSITIGNDCMFSNDIEIRNGDSHSIIRVNTDDRINWAESVTIGNHVWLTAHVRVLKGSCIADNSIIANSSIVTNQLNVPNAIYGGTPAKMLKTDINWDRDRYRYTRSNISKS